MDELARKMGFRRASSIQRYFSEDDFRGAYLTLPIARKFSRAIAGSGDPPITEAEVLVLAGPDARLTSGQQVPEVDFVQAGSWATVTDQEPSGVGWVAVNSQIGPRAFALRIRGRSMEPLYFEGNIIVVDPDVAPQPGDDVVAKLASDTEATFKRYRQKSRTEVELFPLNDMFPILTLNARNPGKIVGVVVEHHRYRRYFKN